MRASISRDSASPRELAEATRRLDHALQQLEAACAAKVGAAPAAALERDRARLAAELEAARARESDLQSAAAAASQALGRAAAEVRAALEAGKDEMGEGEAIDDEAEAASKLDGDGLDEEAA